MTLVQAHALLPASQLVGDADVGIARVHSDTRSLRSGDLFVALRGERFDAHHFLPQARAAGAAAALAEGGLEQAGLPGLLVADTRAALGELAAAWRAKFELPVIAVTGSNGKTTCTQMIAAILRAWLGDGAFATEGNFNNDIGVPLTLLRLRQDATTWHRAGVVELGMNHRGEIAQLAAMVAPAVTLVNNAQREHQEFMHSVEAVARENGAAIAALRADGVAVFPADDAHTDLWRDLAGHRKTLTFALDQGIDTGADITAHSEWRRDHWTIELRTTAGPCEFSLRVAGLHNVKNALAAASCALAIDCPLDAVRRGLEAFAAVQGRSQVQRMRRAGKEITLVDDSYNANPDSVRAAIDLLAQLDGPRWLVLGDMAEVGNQGPAFHSEIGTYAKLRGIDKLWTLGAHCLHTARAFGSARHFDSMAALLAAIPEAPAATSIVVKGSRSMQMEQVVLALRAGQSAGVAGDFHAA
ncbi:MAG: UDP-N-acetylmuramoyl-tripeptide--D-alanyl-D-alanine ligase [Burkholderiaceae bacterium]|nr:UDP-N-acetylmuramoyl-tripeptide--D-alanyl-D-alanine ligase [Burkholderiaceae bacterium]MDH3459696.1 UDP-N-acetylmuramoyl-tripeptide--D-alanyl-D-alanine ligase [Burkholderiaceae bacterium]